MESADVLSLAKTTKGLLNCRIGLMLLMLMFETHCEEIE